MGATLTLRRGVGWGLRKTLFALASHRPPSGIRVLAYHSVDDSGSTLSVRQDELRRQLSILKETGWHTLSAAEYLKRLKGPPETAREVYLTFDDGYQNFCELAVPLLQEFGFRATVFVPTDFIGGYPEWFARDRKQITEFLTQFHFASAELEALDKMMATMASRRLMTAAQLIGVHRAGFDVQSHSAGHHFLPSLSAEELRLDLSRSQRALEELGINSPLLCYPYGASSEQVADAAEASGFQAAFLAVPSGSTAGRYSIGRSGVAGGPNAGGPNDFAFRFTLSAAMDYYTRLTQRA